MPLYLNGTEGVYGVNGTNTTPANRGSDTNTGVVYGTDTVQIATGGTTAVTVDSSQNVGIGTASPAFKLDVSGAINTTISGKSAQLNAAGGSIYASFADGTKTWRIGTGIQSAGLFSLYNATDAITAFNVDSSGNLLVGAISNPLAISVKGYVAGNFAATCLVAGNGSAGSGGGGFTADTFFVQNESANTVRSYSCGTAGNTAYGNWIHYAAKSAGAPIQVFAASNGSFAITGALSKSSGTFKIDHPLPALTDTHHLVHSFIEGPQADLIYRGVVQLVDGKATVNIDEASDMTEGTFVVLCREVQCFTSNETNWDAVRGKVTGNILTIESQNSASTASVSWLVIGERQDKHMMETDWTDDNGKVIVEPLKVIVGEAK